MALYSREQKAHLSLKFQDKIVNISPHFNKGGFFQKNDVLIEIEDRIYKAAVTVAKSDLLSSKLTLEKERIRVKNYENDLISAKSELAKAELSLIEEKARGQQAKEDWNRLNPSKEPDKLVLREPQLFSAETVVVAAEGEE